jgi:DNA end-binding protein Ku
MSTTWNPDEYADSYRERVEELLARKQRGEEILTEGEPAEEAGVTDLMDALRRSAEQMRERRQRQPARPAQSSGKTGKRPGTQGRRRAS